MNDDIIFPKDEAGIDEVPSANSSPLVSHAPTEKSHEDYYAADSRQNQQHQHQQHHPLRNDAAIPDLTAITPTSNRHAPPTSSSDPEKQPTSANASPSAAAAPGADEVNDALPPDGGYGWVCVACCFWINAHTWGLNSSYAVFLAHYLATNAFPGASRLDYAFVGGLSIAVALLVSPLATTVIRLWGTRTCLMVGVVFEAVSFVAASFVGRAWELFLSQGACFGVGMGFLFVGSVGIAPQWFLKRRSLANGIAASGSGLGGLMYSLATNAMIQRIGLPWAFRVLGIIAFVVNFLCVIIIRDRNKQVGSQHLAFDYTLFKRREFLLLQMFGIFSMLGYVVLLFSLPNYANSIGMTAKQGSVVGAVLNLGQAFGRPPIGYFSDSMGRINMAATMTFLAALFCLVIWTFATSFGVLVFYAFIGGTVAGTYWAVIAPVAAEVVGLKHIPSCLSITWIMLVPPTLFSEPIALGIVDYNGGKYRAAQLYAGFMYLGAAGAAVLLRAWKIGELEKIALALDQPTESVDPRMAAVVEARADDGGELRRRMSREKARSSFVKRLWMRRKV